MLADVKKICVFLEKAVEQTQLAGSSHQVIRICFRRARPY